MKPLTEHPYTPELLTHKRYFWNCKTTEELQDYYKHLPHKGDDMAALLAITQNNKKVHRLIASTVPTLDGWSSTTKVCVMAALVLATKPKVCCEIGVWAGRSLFGFAVGAKEIGGCRVVGIDAYSNHVSAENEVESNSTWWMAQDHAAIHRKCLELLKRFDLQAEVVAKKSDDVDPSSTLGRIDLWHCDGSHTEQSVRDVERYAPLIPVGGIAIMDDLHWVMGGPLRAVDTLEDIGFMEAFRVVGNENNESNDWGVWQRVR